jgi:hypothetical protein
MYLKEHGRQRTRFIWLRLVSVVDIKVQNFPRFHKMLGSLVHEQLLASQEGHQYHFFKNKLLSLGGTVHFESSPALKVKAFFA